MSQNLFVKLNISSLKGGKIIDVWLDYLKCLDRLGQPLLEVFDAPSRDCYGEIVTIMAHVGQAVYVPSSFLHLYELVKEGLHIVAELVRVLEAAVPLPHLLADYVQHLYAVLQELDVFRVGSCMANTFEQLFAKHGGTGKFR